MGYRGITFCCGACFFPNAGNISYLQADLIGEGVSTTNIRGQLGNCLIAGSDGDVSIQISLPDSGFCRVVLNSGNIELKIPANTSSILSARSDLGTISLSGFAATDTLRTQNSFTARFGSGRGSIQLSTGKGNISIIAF